MPIVHKCPNCKSTKLVWSGHRAMCTESDNCTWSGYYPDNEVVESTVTGGSISIKKEEGQ